MNPILQVRNLVKGFPVKKNIWGKPVVIVRAVNDVSFELNKGETLGLVGESGCGKTTLGHAILKLVHPDSGSIIYEGKELTSYKKSEMRPLRKELQIIFQDPYSSLNPRMKIGRALMEPLTVHKIVPRKQRYQRAVDLLKLVGLDASDMGKYPHEFSGGQRQRIGIARALTVNPKIIIADEAVSALDISIQAQIINLLMDLKEKLGLTMIFIAHDLKVVGHISDRICVMYLGKIMEIFDADKIDEARHPYTKSLLSAIPVPDPKINVKRQILAGDVPSPISLPSGCLFHPRCPLAIEACRNNTPTQREVGQNHLIACDVV